MYKFKIGLSLSFFDNIMDKRWDLPLPISSFQHPATVHCLIFCKTRVGATNLCLTPIYNICTDEKKKKKEMDKGFFPFAILQVYFFSFSFFFRMYFEHNFGFLFTNAVRSHNGMIDQSANFFIFFNFL